MPTNPPDRKWPFRIALASWLVVGVGTWLLVDRMARPGQIVLASLWLVGLALILRQFLLSLFGPVLAYDMLRVGRRSRQIWFRVAYAILLSILFTWIYISWLSYHQGGDIRPKDMARLAETFFSVYMIVQFIMVCVLTPASVAGAIAEEKERRTLEFLLATDLRDREIVFGKLASRVGSLLLFLSAGLPILTMLQFFGGIDPDLLLAGFAATVMIVLSLAAVGIASSVIARRARDAIALTYLLAIAYVVGSALIYGLAVVPWNSWTFDLLGYTVTGKDLAYPCVAGNPFYMVPVVMDTRRGGAINLFEMLKHFTLFHLAVIVIFVTWAGLKLRVIALKQTFGGEGRSIFRRLFSSRGNPSRSKSRRPVADKPSTRRDVGTSPILWKEIFVDTGLRMGLFAKVVIFGLVALSLVPIGFIFWYSFIDNSGWRYQDPWEAFGEGMNGYLRMAGAVASMLVFLAIAVRGAGVVSGERDRHTLDVLLTTPLSASTIVWGKWLGCILGMRWAWAWIFLIWFLTLLSGGLHPLVCPLALLSLAVYSSGFAWIGIYCSLHMRTTLRATMAALLLSIFCAGGYFLVFVMCCVMPFAFGGGLGNEVDIFVTFLCSFSPPVNMAWLPIRDMKMYDLELFGNDIFYPPFWFIGLLGWGLLSLILSNRSLARFRQMANRLPVPSSGSVRLVSVPPPLPPRRTGES